MEPKKARVAYRTLFTRLREISRSHDPSGLFAMGAPPDEHDDSIHQLISRLFRARDLIQVTEVLDEIFGEWIRESGRDPTVLCRSMAPEVWQAWQDFRQAAEL